MAAPLRRANRRPLAALGRPFADSDLDAAGNKIKPRIVDLSEKGPGGGYKRTIVRSLDPGKFNLNIPAFLLGTTL
ncbi:MAG: hypothetical protein IIA33_07485, partial [Planctomycetes bacterium]|nr:hypothetical protein [Planctomycetota bacterium]